MFLICGTIAAVLTAVTFLLAGRGPIKTVVFTAFAFFVWGFLGWASIPTLAWNFTGPWFLLFLFGIGLFIGLGVSDRDSFDDLSSAREALGSLIPGAAVAVPVIMVFVSWFTTDGMFGHERQYREWLGRTPVTREFTQDVAPIDLEHLRLVNRALAERLGSRTVEQVPSLGSRVHVATPDQQILTGCFTASTGFGDEARQEELCFENELVYVSPLAHDSVFRYWNYGSTPGYVIVSAEDPDRFWLVTGRVQENGEVEPIALRYLVDGGWFNHHVQRYLRSNGYASTGLAEEMFEIDDTGRPFWVVTTFRKTIGFGGEVPTGVLIVDAQTGAIERYSMEEVPAWVDMVQPRDMVLNMLRAWGAYVHGWLNGSMFGGKRDVVQPGDYMVTLHGEDQRSHYVVNLSSANSGHDGAMNSFVLIDTRTREFARYMISGATPNVAAATIENAEGVAANSYVSAGVYPVNVGGEPSYFVPLQGQDGMLKMYGFINIRNLAVYGTGNTPTEAFRAYQAALTRGGTRLNADAIVEGVRIEGVVEAVVREGEMTYLLITGQGGREFFASSSLSPELKWTNAGDRVVLTAHAGEQISMPIVAFDNLGYTLNRTQ